MSFPVWGRAMAALLTALVLYPTLATAQLGGTGTIQGTVSDATGAIIPDAEVTATNVATGVKTIRQSSGAGFYVISSLPPGEYTITVSKTGFQKLTQEKITVDALGTVGLNLTVPVGSTSESVTVSDAPPMVNTEDARMGQTMRNEMYTSLPLQMGVSGIGAGPRNPGAFIYLMPGVQEGDRWGAINGAQGFSKEVYVEGVPITDPIQQGEGRAVNLGFSVEAIEQFQVETSGTGVEFSGQGSENYVIKSGTNAVHGSLFHFFRNTKLDARSFFAPFRPKQNQNEFGGTIGGPIIRNKLFYFGVYNGWRYRVQTDARLVSIPSLKMRQGDFSELLPNQVIYDPATTVALPGGGFSRVPFPNNVIPADRISAISKYFQAPLPTPTTGGVQNNYLGQLPVGYNNDNFTGKSDYHLSEAHKFSGLFTWGKRGQSGPYREVTVPLPLPYTNTREVVERPTVAQIKHNWTIASNLLNQFSFGFNRLVVPITNVTMDGEWTTKAGLQGLPGGEARDSFPEVAFGGPNAPAGWRGTDARDFQDTNNSFTLQDSMQWLRGKHSFKIGYQHQRLQDNYRGRDTGTLFTSNFSNDQTKGFTATGTAINTTGHAYASYLLGAVNSATVADDFVVTTGARFRSNAFWFQDDFKVTRNLTLNLGVRWDIMEPFKEVADRFSYLDPTVPNSAAGGRLGVLRYGGNYAPGALSCNCSTPVDTFFGAVGPRLGFAWAATDKTVLRGAWGVMYTRRGAVGGREGARNGTDTVGFNPSVPLNSINAVDPAFDWDNGIPAYVRGPIYDETYQSGFAAGRGIGGGVTYGDPNSAPPRYQNWNFSLQRSLTNSMVLTVAYVGSNGKNLAGAGRGIWSNQIDPKYLVLGNLLGSTLNANILSQAQARFPELGMPFPNFQGTLAQALKPFPQFNSVADPYGNVGQSNYNSMQVVLNQRLSAGLTFMVNYTFSKSLNNISGGRSAYDWSNAKTISVNDQPHVFNAFWSYDLPFGRGGAVEMANPVARAVFGGWKLSGITRYASGKPLGTIGAACNLPSAGGCQASYNPDFTGDPRINGEWGNGNLISTNANVQTTTFLDRNAFVSPAAFAYGNTPITMAYNLRNPHLFNQDFGLRREFPITENVRFSLQGDAFNAFNNVRFGGINTNITNAAFGKVTQQVNQARVFQISARLGF